MNMAAKKPPFLIRFVKSVFGVFGKYGRRGVIVWFSNLSVLRKLGALCVILCGATAVFAIATANRDVTMWSVIATAVLSFFVFGRKSSRPAKSGGLGWFDPSNIGTYHGGA